MGIRMKKEIIKARVAEVKLARKFRSNDDIANKVGVSLRTLERAIAGAEIGIANALNIAQGLGMEAPKLVMEEDVYGYRTKWPVPIMVNETILEIPDFPNNCPKSIVLMEIVAIRMRSDSDDVHRSVLGYGTLAEETLYTLISNWAGGGFAELMKWGGIAETDQVVFDENRGLAIGDRSEEYPKLVIGFSGCKVRIEFTSPRSETGVVPIE